MLKYVILFAVIILDAVVIIAARFKTGTNWSPAVFTVRFTNGFADGAERRTRRQAFLWMLQLS